MFKKTSPVSSAVGDDLLQVQIPRDDIQMLIQEVNFYTPTESNTPFKGNSLLLTADNRFFVFCSVEGRVAILDRDSNEIINDIQLPGGGLYTIAFYQNETYVFAGGKEAVIRKFLLKDFSEIAQYRGHDEKISEIMFSPDEK